MKVLGFNFTKITAERDKDSKADGSINTNVEFLEIEKDNIEILRDSEIIRVSFKFSIDYKDAPGKEKIKGESKKDKTTAQISFEGLIILSLEKENSKEILKNWKNKIISQDLSSFLMNFILAKCSIKALTLEQELSLPAHFPLPRVDLNKVLSKK